MKIAIIITAATLLAAMAWTFLVVRGNEDAMEYGESVVEESPDSSAASQVVIAETSSDESPTNSAIERGAELPAEEAVAVASEDAQEEELLTKEAIMQKFEVLKAGKESNPLYVIETSILNAKLSLIEQREEVEKSELTEEEQVLIQRILERMAANDPNAKTELYEYLDENSSPALYFAAGNFLAEERNIQGAIDFYLTGLKSDKYLSENTKLRMTRNAGIMMVKTGDHESAEHYLEQAMYLSDAPDGTTLGLLGLSKLETGDVKAAVYYYRQAIDQSPDVVDWRVGLAKALLNTGDYAEGIEVLEKLKTMSFPKG